MTSILLFFYEVVHPADHDVIFFKIFRIKKPTFFYNTPKNPEKTPSNYLYS